MTEFSARSLDLLCPLSVRPKKCKQILHQRFALKMLAWIVVMKARCYKSYWRINEGAANGKDNADGDIDGGIRDIWAGFRS
jgi:hypothetical protein